MIKTYVGERDRHGMANVWVIDVDGDSRALPMRRDLMNHSVSPEWGYLGSGPAQLALAILADAESDSLAKQYHQQFKVHVIAQLPRSAKWKLTQPNVSQMLSAIIANGGPDIQARLIESLRKLKAKRTP